MLSHCPYIITCWRDQHHMFHHHVQRNTAIQVHPWKNVNSVSYKWQIQLKTYYFSQVQSYLHLENPLYSILFTPSFFSILNWICLTFFPWMNLNCSIPLYMVSILLLDSMPTCTNHVNSASYAWQVDSGMILIHAIKTLLTLTLDLWTWSLI